LQDKLRLQTL